jgi:hypothetical protein
MERKSATALSIPFSPGPTMTGVLVPVECFTQSSRQEHTEIVSFGIWSETETPPKKRR